MAFFRDAYFAKLLQMNTLYSTENISHIHWQPDVYETQLDNHLMFYHL